MKIAMIAPGAIPAQTANSVQVMKMANALTAMGHDVRLFALEGGGDFQWDQLAKLYGLSHRFSVVFVPARAFFRRYDYSLVAVREARKWGADYIYTRVPQAAAWASRRGTPTIFELHDLPSGNMGPRLLRQFLRGSGAKRVVVNTRHLAGQIEQQYTLAEGMLALAPNGVDLAQYASLPDPQTARRKLGLPEKFTAGYSGHLYKGRGISFMFELARKLPDVNFLFIGGRPQDLETRKRESEMIPNVLFAGFVPNSELPMYQSACDVLLIPYRAQVSASSAEDIAAFTNPLKMFEYLAARRPVLASDLPILREVLNESNAIILPIGDAVAWRTAIEELKSSESKRTALANAGRATVEEFTWKKRAERVLHGLDASVRI
jgi:glycosyltransferase involved in cell wall biosynthesis